MDQSMPKATQSREGALHNRLKVASSVAWIPPSYGYDINPHRWTDRPDEQALGIPFPTAHDVETKVLAVDHVHVGVPWTTA
jgi:hypothetical protein